MSGQSRVRATNARPPAARTSQPASAPTQTPDIPLQRLASAGSRRALLSLQGATGNRAVQRILSDASTLEEDVATESPELFNVPDAQLPAPGGGQPIPDQVRRGMEGAFGQDFSNVRVHTDSSPDDVGALAYTQGSDVHFRPGMYQPDSQSGREALGHELAHVVQQRAGRVATPQGMGAPVNADPALEAEADAIGRQAARAMDSGAALAAPSAAPMNDLDDAPAQRIAAPVQRLGRDRRPSLAALEERQLVSGQRGMFEPGGASGAPAVEVEDIAATLPSSVSDALTAAPEATATPTPATPSASDGGASAESTPDLDEAGLPEGAESLASIGKDLPKMAAEAADLQAAVGPGEATEAIAEGGESSESETEADSSGLTSVPSSASGIASALGLPSPATLAPQVAAAQASDGSPASVVEDGNWWDTELDAMPTRGRGAIDNGGSRSASASPAAAPAPSASASPYEQPVTVPTPVTPLGLVGRQGASSNVRGRPEGDTAGDVALYSGVGGAVGSATGAASTTSQSLFGGSLTAAGQVANVAGGASVLGGVSSLAEAASAAGQAHVTSGASQAESALAASASLTAAGSSAANAAVGIESARLTAQSGNLTSLSSGATGMMNAAGTAAAGLSVATGSLQVIGGVTQAVASRGRQNELTAMAAQRGDTASGRAAAATAETQRQRAVDGGVTAARGAASVAGGAILLALGLTNPIGLGLLAAAAIAGGAYALYKWWRGKKANKELKSTKPEKQAKQDLAVLLFQEGVVANDTEYVAILISLGFNADKIMKGAAGGITAGKILSKIS